MPFTAYPEFTKPCVLSVVPNVIVFGSKEFHILSRVVSRKRKVVAIKKVDRGWTEKTIHCFHSCFIDVFKDFQHRKCMH